MDELPIVSGDGHRLRNSFLRAQGDVIGDVIFAHGIGGTRNEAVDLFMKAALAFSPLGLNTLRFDFRGHAESAMSDRAMTVRGELEDLRTAADYLRAHSARPQCLVAASFGALSAILHAEEAASEQLKAMVLWSPVIHARRAFVDPGTPWARQAFNDTSLTQLDDGKVDHLEIDGFRLGRDLIAEIRSQDFSERVVGALKVVPVPVRVYHGTADEQVPFADVAEAVDASPRAELIVVESAPHDLLGFHERVVIETGDWLRHQLLDAASPGGGFA